MFEYYNIYICIPHIIDIYTIIFDIFWTACGEYIIESRSIEIIYDIYYNIQYCTCVRFTVICKRNLIIIAKSNFSIWPTQYGRDFTDLILANYFSECFDIDVQKNRISNKCI